MNHLIVGCGYLGRRVASLWLAQGNHVFGVTRRLEGATILKLEGIKPIVADVLLADSLRHLAFAELVPPITVRSLSEALGVRGAELIFKLRQHGALVSTTINSVVEPDIAELIVEEYGIPKRPGTYDTILYAVGLDRASGASMRTVYVDGLANVLDHLPKPSRLIYISSSSVYGQTDGDWVDEDSPTEPQEESGQIVLEAERLLRTRLPEAIILRFAGIYGPGRLLRRKAIEAGEPIVGDAEKWLNLIQVEDGARAVLAAAERGQPGRIYNVCDDQPVRRREFYSELARCLDAPAPRFVTPPADQPVPPHEKGNRRIRNRRMREELGLTPRFASFVEGLRAQA